MKKIVTFAIALFALGLSQTNAQSDYTTAVGLGIDFGTGTLVGPSAKFFLAPESAIQAEVMFESGVTVLTGLYEYHGAINGADGLKWFAGGGPSVFLFGNGFGSEFALRPTVGLDYKINSVPLAFSFDWRPLIGLGDLYNEIGSFGVGIRYVIN